MTIYVMLFLLLGEFIFAYLLFDKNVVAPACVFSAVFLISAFDFFRNIEKWGIALQWNTVFVICGGVFLFIISACISHFLFRKLEYKKIVEEKNILEIEKYKIDLLLLFNLASVILLLINLVILGRKIGVSGNIFNYISAYRSLSTSSLSYDIKLPSYVNYCNLFCRTSGYIWIYLLIKEFIYKRSYSPQICCNLLLSLFSCLLTGGRGHAIFLILSSIPMYFFLWCEKEKRIKKFKLKLIVRILVALFIIALFFKQLGVFLGRDIQSNFIDHISINLSATIANLNIFLQQNRQYPQVWGQNTFGYLIRHLGYIFDIAEWQVEINNPFRYSNGYPLGNVSTTFYAYVHDFGYSGILVLIPVMACIVQFFYEKSLKCIRKQRYVHIPVIIYSIMFIWVAFSFFSNKFFEGLITISFVEQIIILWFITIWFERIKIKI